MKVVFLKQVFAEESEANPLLPELYVFADHQNSQNIVVQCFNCILEAA